MATKKRRPKRWIGYAKEVRGWGGKKYACFDSDGKMQHTVSTTGTKAEAKADVRELGYRIRAGTVKDPYG